MIIHPIVVEKIYTNPPPKIDAAWGRSRRSSESGDHDWMFQSEPKGPIRTTEAVRILNHAGRQRRPRCVGGESIWPESGGSGLLWPADHPAEETTPTQCKNKSRNCAARAQRSTNTKEFKYNPQGCTVSDLKGNSETFKPYFWQILVRTWKKTSHRLRLLL